MFNHDSSSFSSLRPGPRTSSLPKPMGQSHSEVQIEPTKSQKLKRALVGKRKKSISSNDKLPFLHFFPSVSRTSLSSSPTPSLRSATPPPPPLPSRYIQQPDIPPPVPQPTGDDETSGSPASPSTEDVSQLPSSAFESDIPFTSMSRYSQHRLPEAEDWRKSDSTMRAVRIVGGRTPTRPVSVAESSHSGNTVIQGATSANRLSALLVDAEFTMLESDEETPSLDTDLGTLPHTSSSASPVTPSHIRSFSADLPTSASWSEPSSRACSFESDTRPDQSKGRLYAHAMQAASSIGSSASDTLSLTDSDASVPLTTNGSQPQRIRGRLAAWTSVVSKASSSTTSLSPTTSSCSYSMELSATAGAAQYHDDRKSIAGRSLRKTAMSISNGLVEKLGRALGGSSTSLASSSSSISNGKGSAPPSSFFNATAGMGRTNSNNSMSGNYFPSSANGRKFSRRNGRVASGAASTGTASSLSDSEGGSLLPPGPYLGKKLRGPLKREDGSSGGLVFGRDLASCVHDTVVYREDAGGDDVDLQRPEEPHVFEDRLLPALVLRCAQHLSKWGVQEEGLFRVPGRTHHINKLRDEFDTGADFDMRDCGPGEIDPHAVASVFKAYLRELPEPILTRPLMPYFEATLSAETEFTSKSSEEMPGSPRVGQVPPSPKEKPFSGTIRKAPSLSTFAAPTLPNRVLSEPLINALSTLIARLPQENRDLLRTVVELITETSKRSKETKMPLSNLLLIFCPSLAMSPPVLKVLCEAEGIWNGPKGSREPSDDEEEEYEEDEPSLEESDTDHLASEEGPEFDSAVSAARAKRQSIRLALSINPPMQGTDLSMEDLIERAPGEVEDEKPSRRLTPPSTAIFLGAPTMERSDSSSSGSSPGEIIVGPFTHPQSMSVSTSQSSQSQYSQCSLPDEPLTQGVGLGIKSSPFSKSKTRSHPNLISSQSKSKHQSFFGAPLQFPSSNSTGTPAGRRSRLSLSSSSPDLNPSSPSTLRAKRIKRPSLQILFHKRSVASLLTGTPSQSSPPTPASMESFLTAPLANVSSAPPVLDTDIESSSFGFDLDEASEEGTPNGTLENTPLAEHGPILHRIDATLLTPPKLPSLTISTDGGFERSTSASSTSSAYSSTVFYTPVSTFRLFNSQPPSRVASTGSYAFPYLDPSDKVEEDTEWVKSVLMAAGATSPSNDR